MLEPHTIGVLVLTALGAVAHARADLPVGGRVQPELVAPETLESGFTLLVTDASGAASESTPIYLAGSINGWNPRDPDYVLSARSDGRWQIVLPGLDGAGLAFKFTLGSWATEELDGAGNPIDNRSLPRVDVSALAPGERPVIELTVPEFRVGADGGPPRADRYRDLDVAGDVRRLQVVGGAGRAMGLVRDALVWLPPGYDDPANAGRRYPVLYLLDGQNVFERRPGVPGEWRADETAQGLVVARRVEPLIIVAIPHAGPARADEYLAIGSLDGVEARGADFLAWLLGEVKPRVDRAFRTAPEPDRTAIGGASLGGTFGLYAACERPDVFGMALIESLPMLGDDGAAVRAYLSATRRAPGAAFLGMGDHEVGFEASDAERNALYRAWLAEVADRLTDAGADVATRIGTDHTHTEAAWAERLADALVHLFPAAGRSD